MSATLLPYLHFNENAQFYVLDDGETLSQTFLQTLFREVSQNKKGNYLLNLIKQEYSYKGQDIAYSICAFKYLQVPSVLTEYVNDEWMEQKIAYLLVIHIDKYVILVKRNITSLTTLMAKLIPIDYSTITTLFVNNDTQFEKLGLVGTNISDNSIREKQYEANDLKESYSFYGASNYVLGNFRLSNESKKVSISSGTSRIASLGNKGGIKELIHWGYNIVEKMKTFSYKENYLSIFAQPLDFESQRDALTPIAILFLFGRLKSSFEKGEVLSCAYNYEGKSRPFNLINQLDRAATSFKIEVYDEKAKKYKVVNKLDDGLMVQFNPKSISVKSEKLKNVVLTFDDGRKLSLLEYFNNYNTFIINFEHADVIYTNRKLFKDHRLLNSTEYFFKIFLDDNDMNSVTSEKGTFTKKSKQFSKGSVFNFVEKKFIKGYKYVICDDLGREWADHICLSEDSITFIHSKFGTSTFSATAFADIVAQAQKNLGNIRPADFQLDAKYNLWKNSYSTDTSIKRLRKGDNIENAVKHYKELRHHPNLKQNVYLALNFISKEHLIENITKLKDGEAFTSRNETIQILWYISSLISSCKELGIDAHIICKP